MLIHHIEGRKESQLLQNIPYALRKHGTNCWETFAKQNPVWLSPRLHTPVVPAPCQHVTGAHHKGQCSKCNWEAGGNSLDSVTHSSQGALVHLLESEVIFFFFFCNSVGLTEIWAIGKYFPSPKHNREKVMKSPRRRQARWSGGC